VQDTLARGKTAIILVPEIALTLWIGRQCRAWFGAHFEGVAVLHSALSDVERAREWWRVRNGEARVVVGTRSAIFAPSKISAHHRGRRAGIQLQAGRNAALPRPRRAIVRAKLENASRCSAPPRLRWKPITTLARQIRTPLHTQRVADRALPSVEILDLREEFKQTHRTSPISSVPTKGN
jgi:primosomal protein N' (replication factor Y)